MDELAALVEQLALFCRRHVDGDGVVAADGLRDWLESAWPEIPKIILPSKEERRLDGETVVIEIVAEVGEVAGMLLRADDLDRALASARASLLISVERYPEAIG